MIQSKMREAILALTVSVVGSGVVYLAFLPRIETRQRSLCTGNLASIGRGLMQYLQDHDETYPRSWFGTDAGASDASANYKWMDALFPYIRNESTFICPADGASKEYRYRNGENYGSYVMNNAYFKPGDNQTPPSGLRASQIPQIANTVFFTDGSEDFQFAWSDAKHTPSFEGERFFQLSSIQGRHAGKVNGSALPLSGEGAVPSSLLRFETITRIVDGERIYPLLTIEDD